MFWDAWLSVSNGNIDDGNVTSDGIYPGFYEPVQYYLQQSNFITIENNTAVVTPTNPFPYDYSYNLEYLNDSWTLNEDALSGNTGSIAAFNSNDSAALTGALTVLGSFAATNSNDSSSLTGVQVAQGFIAATNTSDKAALSGVLTVTGAIAALNTNDSASLTGAVISSVSGSISAFNKSDSAQLSGNVTLQGAITARNSNDSANLSGQLTVAGTLQARNTDDRAALTGALTVAGIGNARNTSDSATITGTVTGTGSTGSINAVNNNDSANLQGAISEIPTTLTGGGSAYLPSQRAYSPSDLPSSKDKAQKQQREKLTLKTTDTEKNRDLVEKAVIDYDYLLDWQDDNLLKEIEAKHLKDNQERIDLLNYLEEQEKVMQQNEEKAIMTMIAELL